MDRQRVRNGRKLEDKTVTGGFDAKDLLKPSHSPAPNPERYEVRDLRNFVKNTQAETYAKKRGDR